MFPNKILRIHSSDNIIVALTNLSIGDIVELDGVSFALVSDVKAKHKFALRNFTVDEKILMYGVVVGNAKNEIAMGELITTKNIVHETEAYTVPKKSAVKNWTSPKLSAFSKKHFLGYHRDDGRVGTENNWLVIPLVFCQNRNIDTLQASMLKELGYENPSKKSFDVSLLVEKYKSGASEEELLELDLTTNNGQNQRNRIFPNVDGLHFLTHEGGCGGSTSDAVTLCNLLAGYINNPNVAGATILSLGCQHAQMNILERALKRIAKPSISTPIDNQWKANIAALSKFEHVSCKISGMVTEAKNAVFSDDSFTPFLDHVFSAFGPNRLLFGSDWPVCLLAADYSSVLSIIMDYLEQLSCAQIPDLQSKLIQKNN